jgi:hypothetical protein
MNYKLHISKHDSGTGWVYHFAVVDKSKSYPANFICTLPTKPVQSKTENGFNGKFGSIFGEKSKEIALDLLNCALKTEEEAEVKEEIKKRLKLIEPKQANIVLCSRCKKPFEIQKKQRHKRRLLCEECLKKQYSGSEES